MDGQLAQASLGLGSQTTPWIQMGISEYLDELTPKQQEVFRASFGETANLNDVLSALQQQQKRTSSQKRAIFIRQMEALSKPLQQFSTALDVVVQAQAVASLIWGPLKAVVLVAKTYVDALEMIAKVLEQITSATIRFRDYEDLFPDSPIMRSVLINYYAYLIRFLVRTYKVCSSRRGIFLRSVLQPLKIEMEEAVKCVVERSQEVDVSALLADMKHSRNERALQAEKIANISTELQSKQEKQLRLWLSPVDCISEHNRRLSRRLPGTCQWLLDMPQFIQSNPIMGPGHSNLSWLSGKPGCGKSILASALIRHISHDPSNKVLFFFFNAAREAQNSFSSLLRSLLFQMLDLDTQIVPLLLPLYNSSGEDHPMSHDILWAAFARSIAVVSGLICVVDAVDECEDRDIVLPKLVDISREFPSIRLVLISRPLFDIASALDGNCFHHHIEAMDVKSDIEAYIADSVEKSTKLQKTNLKAEIVASLSRGSDGMFLWALLLLDDLTTLPTIREIKKRLSALPTGLHAIYRQILSGLKASLKPHQLELSKKVLTWVTSTTRPLKLSEIDVALAVNPGDTVLDEECRMLMPEADILQTCGPLIEIIGSSTVQVVHLSVKEFLTRPQASWTRDDQLIKDLLVDPQDANAAIAQTCIDYLSFDKFVPPYDKYIHTDELLTYASTHWVQHFSVSGSKLCGYVERFTTSHHAIFWIESWMHEYRKSRGANFDPDDVVLLEASLTKALSSHTTSALETEEDSGIIAIFERRREFAISTSGSGSEYALKCSSDLGRCYYRQGKHAAAEEIFTQILATQELNYGAESEQALDSIADLALLHHDQGRLAESEILHARVYEGRKAALGQDAVATLESMVGLAMIYYSRGKFADAERVNIAVLEKWKEVVGEDNPGIMNILNNLALVYRRIGKFDRALELFQDALEGRERLLGKDHPDSMASLHHIGDVFMAQGRLQDSQKALEESLSRRRRVLIKDHIDTLDGIHSLAQIYERLDRIVEAEQLLSEAITACRNTLPPQHPYTNNVLCTLSLVYMKQQRYSEAIKLQIQAYEGRRRIQGETHPNTLSCEHNLGRICQARGDLQQAKAHFMKAYELRKENLGQEHPDTTESKTALSLVLAESELGQI